MLGLREIDQLGLGRDSAQQRGKIDAEILAHRHIHDDAPVAFDDAAIGAIGDSEFHDLVVGQG